MKKIFTVYDSKAGYYFAPLFYTTSGEAIRAFSDVVNDSDHLIGKNPTDFTLFDLGGFDEFSGVFSLNVAPVSIGSGVEFLKSNPVNANRDRFDA